MPRARRSSPATGAVDPHEALAEYREKRDFQRTPEPPGDAVGVHDGPLTFVIQKHRATRLHYDLRLEVDGVMQSWSVPRGPSTDTSERRLAVMTEEHPLSYAVFEGLIPAGEYGAGEVIVWDRGTFAPDDPVLVFEDRDEACRQVREGIANGKLSVTFRGHRMKGSWALVRTNADDRSWLLLKHRDAAATGVDLAERHSDSVLSGITIADLQGGFAAPAVEAPVLRAQDLPGAKPAAIPQRLEPMQASQSSAPFSNPDWVFEPKLDGIRAVATLEHGQVRLVTRRGNDITAAYPALAATLERQAANRAVFDGEIVALDERGVPSFELLQQRMNLGNAVEIRQADRDVPVIYYAFDLPYLDGIDLRGSPLHERRRLLERTLQPSPRVQLVEQLDLDGEQAYEAVSALGLEGLVAKRRDSRYVSGARSTQWLKVKRRFTDEFVVYGYTRGQNARTGTFGALLLATHAADGALVPIGRAGSGFDDRMLRTLRERLDAMAAPEPPLPLPPDLARTLRGEAVFVRPELVVEVEYSQITADHQLRAPVFLRVREDKDASEVHPAALLAPPGDAAGSVAPTDARSAGQAVLEQLDAIRREGTIEVEGHRVRVSSLDKVMWPAWGEQPPLTKRHLIAYYARMAPEILHQVRDRPLTMTRFPNGLEGESFYQKHVDDPPAFVDTVTAHTESGGGDQPFLLVNNVATLTWLAQMADLALHTSLARVRTGPGRDGEGLSTTFAGSREQVERSLLNYPDFVLFDLDPYIYRGDERGREEPELNRRAFEATCDVARWLKELLDSIGMAAFVKTSGATGLHVYVPVVRQHDYETIRGVAQTLGGFLVRQHAKQITMEWSVDQRRGKVFFDANQNARNKNLACAYSPRAKPGAPVSMPLRWNDLGKVYPTDFTILTAPDRLAKAGDLWAHILEAKQDLETLLGLTS